MGSGYIFDRESASFRKITLSVGAVLYKALKWLVATLSLSVLYYILFSFFINTDTDRRLMRENKMYQALYPELRERGKLLSDVVEDLRQRDNEIYENIFHTAAPSVEMMGSEDFLSGGDSIPDSHIVSYTADKLDALDAVAAGTEEAFLKVFGKLASGASVPPLASPLENFNYAQAGASVGQKISPFYKVATAHMGLDMIAGQGSPVLAAADGTVSSVVRSGRGQGNVVEIDHGGGYVTRYAHLAGVMVSKGQKVQRGRQVGSVGMSGNSLIPHLHYEVLKDGNPCNPVNYLFGTLSPEQYANVMFMASVTGQSMD